MNRSEKLLSKLDEAKSVEKSKVMKRLYDLVNEYSSTMADNVMVDYWVDNVLMIDVDDISSDDPFMLMMALETAVEAKHLFYFYDGSLLWMYDGSEQELVKGMVSHAKKNLDAALFQDFMKKV